MPASLQNQFISDLYSSLLHLSGAELGPYGPLNKVFDGKGNATGLALSGDRVVVNNYIYPRGFTTRPALEWLDCFFPVGSLQLTFDDNNPTDRIAGTTWVQVAEGRFLVGTGKHIDKNGTERDFCPGGEAEEKAGLRGGSGDIRGEYKVTLTEDQLPSHSHLVDIGAVDVQVPNEAGDGFASQTTDVGTVDSTLSFVEQLQARHDLMAFYKLGTRNSPLYDGMYYWERAQWNEMETPPGGVPIPYIYALDFEFDRGTARKYPNKEEYTTGWAEKYQFKEMYGLWNGETRFVSDVRNAYPDMSAHWTGGSTSISGYEFCKRLGAVDIGEAIAGGFLTDNNPVPTITGNTQILNRQENANKTRVSATVGAGEAHNNILPSYGVYVWKRTA